MSETLKIVADLIRKTIDEEWAEEVDIQVGTSFSEDLELESIEFVALADLVQVHYGDTVDFVKWLSAKELDQIIALKVGDLVEFIDGCRTS